MTGPQALTERAERLIAEAATLDELHEAQVELLGKNSALAAARHSLRDLDETERPAAGQRRRD